MAKVHVERIDEFREAGWNLAETQQVLNDHPDSFGVQATKEDLKGIPVEDLEKGTANFAFGSTVQDGDSTDVPYVYRVRDGSARESARWVESGVYSFDRALVRD